MEPWILPEPVIVEDAPCEMCDEPGLPHDEADQDSYCAEHQMAWETGVVLEDYTEGAIDLRDAILNHLHSPPITDRGTCDFLGCYHQDAISRVLGDGIVTACTECAVNMAFPVELLDQESWVVMLADEIIDP